MGALWFPRMADGFEVFDAKAWMIKLSQHRNIQYVDNVGLSYLSILIDIIPLRLLPPSVLPPPCSPPSKQNLSK